MTKRRYFVFTLDLIVTDPRQCIKVARDKAEREGCPRAIVNDTATALRWLLDPGGAFLHAGIEIQDSGAEEIVLKDQNYA